MTSDEEDDLFPDAAAASPTNTATEMADGESARGMESSGMALGENHQGYTRLFVFSDQIYFKANI